MQAEVRRREADLVRKNVGLAMYYAKRYNVDIPIEDRFQEALLGILEGVRKYDPDRDGGNFRSCIIGWIKQRLWRMNKQKAGAYCIPMRIWRRIFRGDERYLKYLVRAIPSEKTIHDPPSQVEGPEEIAVRRVFLGQMTALADRVLAPRLARVVCLYYGLGGQPPATLAEIGILMGVCRERIRQLRNRALEQLRAELERSVR